MTKNAPDKYQQADAWYTISRSPKTLSAIFGIVLLVSLILAVYGFTQNHEWASSFGVSFIAGSCIALATLAIENIKNGQRIRAEELNRSGIMAAYPNRALPEYDRLVQVANEIDVTGYTLKSFSEQNEEYLRKRACQGSSVRVRLLLVDPNCEASKIMEAAEGLSTGTYNSYCDAAIAKLSGIDGISIRKLNRHLSMMVYRIDSVLYTGFYPQSGKSRMALTLKISDGWMFEQLASDFNHLWEIASDVQL